MDNLGKTLRDMRIGRGMTQPGVAAAFGVTQSAVAAHEGGVRRPSIDNLRKYADLYGVPLDELVALMPPVKQTGEDTAGRDGVGGEPDPMGGETMSPPKGPTGAEISMSGLFAMLQDLEKDLRAAIAVADKATQVADKSAEAAKAAAEGGRNATSAVNRMSADVHALVGQVIGDSRQQAGRPRGKASREGTPGKRQEAQALTGVRS